MKLFHWHGIVSSMNNLIVKNRKVALPPALGEQWENAQVAILPSRDNDTLIIKRMQKPLRRLSDIAARNTLPRMSKQAINKEIRAYRNR